MERLGPLAARAFGNRLKEKPAGAHHCEPAPPRGGRVSGQHPSNLSPLSRPSGAGRWRPEACDCFRAGRSWIGRAGDVILERIANAQRQAGPDRRTEIERHPGNLALPLGNVVRHDPARAHVAKTLEKSQELAALGEAGPPAAQIHRHVDGNEECQIAGDARDGDDEPTRPGR